MYEERHVCTYTYDLNSGDRQLGRNSVGDHLTDSQMAVRAVGVSRKSVVQKSQRSSPKFKLLSDQQEGTLWDTKAETSFISAEIYVIFFFSTKEKSDTAVLTVQEWDRD
ncbi:hypothetical protein TNCV_1100071 [Trichonephila clavipes]|nr:hypothetical protein TNCV_1100071 [Trichonephila clavipes]